TKPQFIQHEIERGRKSSEINGWKLDDDYYRESAEERWGRSKLKDDEIPQGLYERYLEIYETLHPLFIKDSSVDLGKIHKTHKSEIRLAISGDVYVEELKNDEIDFNLLEDVCGSVGIIIPKRVYDLKEKVEAGLYKRRSEEH